MMYARCNIKNEMKVLIFFTHLSKSTRSIFYCLPSDHTKIIKSMDEAVMTFVEVNESISYLDWHYVFNGNNTGPFCSQTLLS